MLGVVDSLVGAAERRRQIDHVERARAVGEIALRGRRERVAQKQPPGAARLEREGSHLPCSGGQSVAGVVAGGRAAARAWNQPLVGSFGWVLCLGLGAEVCAFALFAEEAEELDWFGIGSAEPVRYVRVELGRFTG